MTNNANTIPAIDGRFLEPEGWRWHSFERAGRRMRFGSVSPKGSIPDAVIVCMQGVREFNEKYFETARWALDRNMAFWVFDWVGQGKSARYLENREKRHGENFEQDIDDLQYFILEYIKHASVHPDRGRIPLAMLAHSMGANIGLRFLHRHPTMFECAAFSAPMLGLKAFQKIPQPLALAAACVVSKVKGKSYIPHGDDWSNQAPQADKILSGDAQRSQIHNAWMEADPSLRCGDVTLGWVYQAQKSCLALQKVKTAAAIPTPMVIGIPEHEHLVDNAMTRKVAANIPHAKILELGGAHHEILMEKDDIRNAYLDAFYNLITERIINRPESLKPF